ncbi:MAG: hypothetical protein JJT85_09590 [Chromatiales bacterium]|nr:hypothetical protein [Chromatiales bacterium]
MADLRPAACALLLVAGGASAQQLEILPKLDVSLIASDNIELAEDEAARKDLVTLVNPSVRLISSGARHDLDTRYRMDLLHYAKSRDRKTEVFNDLDSQLGLRLVGDALRLDSRASVTQVNKDPRESFSNNNIARTGNRRNSVNLETRPSWQQPVFGNLLSTSYTIGEIRYSDDDLIDTTYHLFNTRIDSREVETGVSWNLVHSYRRFTYDEFPDYRNQLLQLETAWNTRAGFSPFFMLGLETDFRDRTGSGLDDGLWLAGARQSGQRFMVELAGGRRSFGDTFRALIEFRYGEAAGDLIRFSYSEEPTNTEEQRLRRRQDFRPIDPEFPEEIEAPGTGRTYTRKRAELLVRREWSRIDMGLRLYNQRDDDFLLDETLTRGTNRESGASATLDWRLGARTELRFSGLLTQRRLGFEEEDRGRDRRWRIRAGIDYELGQRTSINAYAARDNRSGSAFTRRTYQENQVGLGVSRRFY